MGNGSSASTIYSVEVEPSKTPNRTGVYRAATHPDVLVSNLAETEVNNCWDLFKRGRSISPTKACLGRRARKADGSLGAYEWLTYEEVDLAARKIGTSIINMDLAPIKEFPDEVFEGAQRMRQLGMFSKNRLEWYLIEQAANAYGVTLVPLYDTLGEGALRFILEETQLSCVACSAEGLQTLLKVVQQEGKESVAVKSVICFDPVSPVIEEKAVECGVKIHAFDEMLRRSMSLDDFLPPTPAGPSGISTLCYTSGTTGNPKGVLISQGNLVACVCGAIRGPMGSTRGFEVTAEDTHISYLPLAHVFERIFCNIIIGVGARIGIFSGDTQKLLDDVRALEPSIFISVPRLFYRINDKVFGGVKEKSGVAQFLFNNGVNTKLKNLRKDATVTHPLWDKLVFSRIRQLMGGKLRYMVAGGAPIDALIQERIKVLFCAPLCEGYGLTETVGGSFITGPRDSLSGHVGGPLPCLEFCIESVPEMEYLVDDEEAPRGELLLRGPALSKGYFRNPTETAKAIDEEGWFHTGDIVVLLPNKGIKIVDRRKNIFKLAQGEYIVPERIESVYQQAQLVGQVFAFGYSTKFVLVGIVYPDEDEAIRWAHKNNVPVSPTLIKDLCSNSAFKAALVADMDSAAKAGGLKGFEKLKEIALTPEPFTAENGLLTPTFKLKRFYAKQVFETQIDSMYKKLENA